MDQAMDLFWRQGYEGTSIADLTATMGISPPSLYAAFGSKRQLFGQAADRYAASHIHYLETALTQPTARETARSMLTGTVEAATLPGRPVGCFNIQAALACRDTDHDVTELLAQRRRATHTALRTRFEQAVADGDLTAGTDCSALARYVVSVAQGINIEAAAGAARDELLAVVELAMAALPRCQ
ncbi:TetR/AcrR family transcriptional regulator [Streptomyces mirabilis]|uniref:TetR/AcrR family transcriptional regulator n=1 Tax=Streptomyces mirabilis TaxID=68239 RepID=UPI0037BC88B5